MNRRAFLSSVVFLSLGKVLLISRDGELTIFFGTDATLMVSNTSWELSRKDGMRYCCNVKLPISIASMPKE